MPEELETEFEAAFESTPELTDDAEGMPFTEATVFLGDDPIVSTETSEDPTLDGLDDVVETLEDPETDTLTDGTDDSLTAQVFDWATEKDKLVTIKVAGEDVQVPLGEALNGYMRQADYTKKTQLIAEDRKYADWARDMQRAFQENPAGTIQYLQQALGVDPSGVETDPLADVDPELRPVYERQSQLEQQLQAAQAEIARSQQERILNEVKAEIQSVKDEFPDFDAQKVLPLAADRGLPIRDAYLLVQAQEMVMSKRNEEEAKRRASETAKREAAKRTANGQIATASTAQRAKASAGVPKDLDSFDAMLNWEFEKAGT